LLVRERLRLDAPPLPFELSSSLNPPTPFSWPRRGRMFPLNEGALFIAFLCRSCLISLPCREWVISFLSRRSIFVTRICAKGRGFIPIPLTVSSTLYTLSRHPEYRRPRLSLLPALERPGLRCGICRSHCVFFFHPLPPD